MKKPIALLSSLLILATLPGNLVLAEELPPTSATTEVNASVDTSTDAASDSTDASVTAVTTTLKDFTDVPVDSPYFNAIISLRNEGVISGYPDNTFHPDQSLNRVEALKLIFEVSNIPLQDGIAQAKFSDIEVDAWYSGYLNKAAFLEVVNGYPDGTFKPEKPVNLVEFLKMLEIAQMVDLSNTTLAQIPYADVAPGEWYSKYVNFAKINGLLDVGADNKIFPDAALTRGRAAQIIFRFRAWRADHPFSNTDQSDEETPVVNNTTDGATLIKDFALYVSEGYVFALQYPRLWFYSTIENTDGTAIRTYGFGPKDLATNPPVVRLELMPDNTNFKTNLASNGFTYLREENATGDVILSAKIANSSRVYRLSGQSENEATMLTMLTSLTANIDGLKSYNPSETPAATTTETTIQTTST